MTTRNLESIYQFELATRLKSLVGGSVDGESPGGARLYLAYVDGKVTSPGIDALKVEREVEAVFTRAFGKRLAALTDEEAWGLSGCRDSQLREAIEREIAQSRAAGSCSSAAGLRRFLQGYCQPAELRRSRGALARRLLEESQINVGLEGEVVSSGDWAFMREDGVFCSDARFTIEALDGTLLSCHLQGRSDLSRALGGAADLETYRRWQNGEGSVDRLPLALQGVLRFEVAGDPGPKAEFAAPRWLRAGGCFWKYRHLNRGLFLASGTLLFDRRNGSREIGYASSLALTVREVSAVAQPFSVEAPGASESPVAA